MRTGTGRHQAAQLVVIGEGQNLHAIAVRALDDGLGRQGAVGDHRVAMQVGVDIVRIGGARAPRISHR